MGASVTVVGGTNTEQQALREQFINNQTEVAEETPTETETQSEEVATPEEEATPEAESESADSDTETAETEPAKKEPYDFSGKDFEETQRALDISARLNSLSREKITVNEQKENLVKTSFKEPQVVNITDDTQPKSEDIIQMHLDNFTLDELTRYVKGSLTDARVQARIDEFFENPDTHEVLELSSGPAVKNKTEEYDFKRGLLLYFKQNDEYIAKIDKELEAMNQTTAEFEDNIAQALNPMKDNILAYTEYLFKESEPADDDTAQVSRAKRIKRKKAYAIRSGYTLENMVDLMNRSPKIKEHALSDFHDSARLREIGERYARKLKTAKIGFDLFPLLSDDPHESLEYRVLPQGDYPAGMEGFTVFFIIRSLGMSLPNSEDQLFHASVQVAFTQLIKGEMDPDVAETVKRSIQKFLALFT
jgi:hypothetical protein